MLSRVDTQVLMVEKSQASVEKGQNGFDYESSKHSICWYLAMMSTS